MSQKGKVWSRGRAVPGLDPKMYRRDSYGRVMNVYQYGNRQSAYGWEIDHIRPVSKGGGNHLSNLQPLNWKSNVKKSNR